MKHRELKKLETLARIQKEQSLFEVKSLSTQLHSYDEKIVDLKKLTKSMTNPIDAADATANDRWAIWLTEKTRTIETKRGDIAARLQIAKQRAARTIGRQNVVETLISQHHLALSHSANRRNCG